MAISLWGTPAVSHDRQRGIADDAANGAEEPTGFVAHPTSGRPADIVGQSGIGAIQVVAADVNGDGRVVVQEALSSAPASWAPYRQRRRHRQDGREQDRGRRAQGGCCSMPRVEHSSLQADFSSMGRAWDRPTLHPMRPHPVDHRKPPS